MAFARATSVVVLLLLAGSAFAQMPYTLLPFGDDGKTTFTGRARANNTLVFGQQLIAEQALGFTTSTLKNMATGKFSLGEPVPKNIPLTNVKLSCLNSVAPAPLNWKMWCPGKDAKVQEYTDKSGARHRIITLRPQKEITALQAIWFMTWYTSGMGFPIVEYQGNHYNFYHLWHPLDHVESATKFGLALTPMNRGVSMYTLIHERYRNPKGMKNDRHYETNGWFFAEDPIGNMMKQRYVLDINMLGINMWTMVIDFIDTKEGLVVKAEIILGVPPKGYDTTDPVGGNFAAATLNDALVGPLLGASGTEEDFKNSIDAITRHTIEEFSNIRHFVPYLYKKQFGKLSVIKDWPTIGDFMHTLNLTRMDKPTLDVYALLRAAFEKLPTIDASNTLLAKAAVALDDKVEAFTQGPAGAFHSAATPEFAKKAPQLKAESQFLTTLKGIADSVTAPVKSLASAVATPVKAVVDPLVVQATNAYYTLTKSPYKAKAEDIPDVVPVPVTKASPAPTPAGKKTPAPAAKAAPAPAAKVVVEPKVVEDSVAKIKAAAAAQAASKSG